VVIRGLAPGLLLNNPAGPLERAPSARRSQLSALEEATERLYWTEDRSSIAIPSWNLHRGLITASYGWKLPSNRKVSLSPYIAGEVEILPYFIPFGTKEHKVFVCRAVVKGQGILRARPHFPEWSFRFDVTWEGQHLGKDFHQDLLPELLARLGSAIGIGDFRPDKKGKFGRFEVVSITLIQ
jgi:hypothetical protein